jgi:hypothetical protein
MEEIVINHLTKEICMFRKNVVAVVVVVAISIFAGVLISSAQEGQCTKLLTTVCNDCHNTDRVCDSMGGPEKKWKAILDWMISNGAELEEEEIALLLDCMTEPYEEAKKACGK